MVVEMFAFMFLIVQFALHDTLGDKAALAERGCSILHSKNLLQSWI